MSAEAASSRANLGGKSQKAAPNVVGRQLRWGCAVAAQAMLLSAWHPHSKREHSQREETEAPSPLKGWIQGTESLSPYSVAKQPQGRARFNESTSQWGREEECAAIFSP